LTYDIVYERCPWHTRAALLNERGELVALRYDDMNHQFIGGMVILGRVRKVVESLNAAFVDIGDVVDGFLPFKKVPKELGKITEGMEIMVRIVRSHTEEKGALLDGYVIHERPEGKVDIPCVVEEAPVAMSRILQAAGLHPVRVWIVDDRTRGDVIDYVPESKIFQLDKHEDVDLLETLDNGLEKLQHDTFSIAGGARLTIEKTKALTSIDIDSASYQAGGYEETALAVNMAAAEEVARLCRLLNIGGNIIIDFITTKSKKDRQAVKDCLVKAFEDNDLRHVDVLNMSPFGLMEINREKVGIDLIDELNQPMHVAGEILLKMWRAKPGSHAFSVTASPEVAALLKGFLTTANALAYLGVQVDIKDNLTLHTQEYQLMG